MNETPTPPHHNNSDQASAQAVLTPPHVPPAPYVDGNFDMGEAVMFGFNQTQKHFGFFLPIMIIGFIVQIIDGSVGELPEIAPLVNLDFALTAVISAGAISLAMMIISYILNLIMLKAGLDIMQVRRPSFQYLLPSSETFWKYTTAQFLITLVSFIVATLIILVGFVTGISSLFIDFESLGAVIGLVSGLAVAGLAVLVALIYFLIRLRFTFNVIVWNSVSLLPAIKESFRITQGKFGALFAYSLLELGVVALGFAALGIGLLWAIPTIVIADAFVFLKISRIYSPMYEVAAAKAQGSVAFNPNAVPPAPDTSLPPKPPTEQASNSQL